MVVLKGGRSGEIYNAVDDEPVTQIEFFQWLSNRVGRKLPPFAADRRILLASVRPPTESLQS